MFGNPSLPSRIYSYGAQAPISNLDRVRQQMYLAFKYRNRLVELELQRRQASETVLARLAPGLQPLVQRVETIERALEATIEELKKEHAQTRTRQAGRDHALELKQTREQLAEARAQLKEARDSAWERADVQMALEPVAAAHAARQRLYRAESGLYWGSYLHVEQSCSKFGQGAPPVYHSWRGDGHLAVQIQKGMSWNEALSGRDQRLRVDIYTPTPGQGPRACYRQESTPGSNNSRRRLFCRVSLRIGSAGTAKKPVWATVPTVLHRPLPADSTIKWAHLLRRRVGPDDRWYVQLVVSRADGFPKLDQAKTGHVGIDLGWRLTAAGLRVAFWVGDDGDSGAIVLPHVELDRWKRSEKLQARRDRTFNDMRRRFASWLVDRDGSVPEWLRERTENLPHWRSPSRLTAVVWEWRQQRFAGDGNIYRVLENWRKQERRLYRCEAGTLRKAQEWREHLYRNAVVALRRRYHTAHVEDIDWRLLALRARVEDEASVAPYQRRLAAPGRLAELIHEHMAEVAEWPAEYTTQRCHACRKRELFDSRKDLVHCCSQCGALWDQDANAARVLLAYGKREMRPLRAGS